MKIWGNIPKVSSVYGTNKINTLSKVSEISTRRDELTISGVAKDFNVAMKALGQVPDIRQGRIDEISQKMERGEYSVSASDIAEKLIQAFSAKK